MDLQKIISKAKSKDKQAEKLLFLRFAPFVKTICRRYASQAVEADDFFQECFILVFRNIKKYDASKGAFQAWLNRVCTNRILQLLRKKKNEISIVFPEYIPEKEITTAEIPAFPQEDIIAAIQKLPKGYREVFNLYVFEGWSHEEISTELNIGETTSRSQLSRARKMLKFILEKKRNHTYERKLA